MNSLRRATFSPLQAGKSPITEANAPPLKGVVDQQKVTTPEQAVVTPKELDGGASSVTDASTKQAVPPEKQKETMSFLGKVKEKIQSLFKNEGAVLSKSERISAVGMGVVQVKVNTVNLAMDVALGVSSAGASVLKSLGEHAVPTLLVAAQGLGAGCGAVSILSGVRTMCKAAACYNRSEGLKTAGTQIDTMMKGVSDDDKASLQLLKDDLKFCQDNNRTRAKDMALSGFGDVAIGSAMLTAAIVTSGASVGAAMGVYAGVTVARVAARAYRGATMAEDIPKQKNDIQTRMEGRMSVLQDKIKTGEPLDVKDKALLVALKSVKLIPKDTNIDAPLSPKIKDTLSRIGHDDISNKFTQTALAIQLDKNTSFMKTAGSVIKSAIS